ncbi:hypothetical protein E2C01_099078 [Portunus trituberculatus]|uniref:Uncharacterized protein n=1 Tax=Portunus trituberculatus TaxID=210409 RepID=A0A5B7KEH2_PORTR|nr:hypothetical protein [Portunus trituberculatus]
MIRRFYLHEEKINGHSLHYLNPPHKFLKLYKVTK